MAKVTGSRSSCRSRRDLKQRQFQFNLKFSPLTQQRFFRSAACYGLLFVGRLICYINSASIVGRKIESTVNTQLSFSFSTPPSTVNSQQSTIIPVRPELISLIWVSVHKQKPGNF